MLYTIKPGGGYGPDLSELTPPGVMGTNKNQLGRYICLQLTEDDITQLLQHLCPVFRDL
jgi:hypothetical protein